MRVEGVMFICTRCGKNEFHPWQPLHNKYPDPEPGEWLTVNADVHLCPKCAEHYRDALGEFLGTTHVDSVGRS